MLRFFIKADSKLEALKLNSSPKKGDIKCTVFLQAWTVDDRELFIPSAKLDTYHNHDIQFNDKTVLKTNVSVMTYQDGYTDDGGYIRDWVFEKNTLKSKKISIDPKFEDTNYTAPIFNGKVLHREGDSVPTREFSWLDESELIDVMNALGYWETTEGSSEL